MFTTKSLFKIIGQNVLISIIAILVTLALIFYISKNIENISNYAESNRNRETELKKRTELIEIIKNDAQIIGTNDAKIEAAFISSNNISAFINTLDELASKFGISQVYRFETPTPSTILSSFPVSTITYSNSTETNISTFSNYLKEFDKLPYFTNIEGFNISSQDKNGWLGKSTITFHATLYTKVVQ